MKQIILAIVISLSAWTLHAQDDSLRREKEPHNFPQHEVKLSFSDGIVASLFWWEYSGNGFYWNMSLSYLYRPVKWLWVGANFVNYYGGTIRYTIREYYPDGVYRDWDKSKIKYCGVFAPEIRFSYLNRPSIILYSALSGGIGWQNGFSNERHTYPSRVDYFHITAFGVSGNFGEDKNILFGGELGIGSKEFINIHVGYGF